MSDEKVGWRKAMMQVYEEEKDSEMVRCSCCI